MTTSTTVRSRIAGAAAATVLLGATVSLTAAGPVLAAPDEIIDELPGGGFPPVGAGPTWISTDGNNVGFAVAYDMVGDGLGGGHFMRDRGSATTTRVLDLDPNLGTVVEVSDDLSTAAVFTSVALVPADVNGTFDIYSVDIATGVATLISATPSGDAGNGLSRFTGVRNISADGRFFVFESAATDLTADVDSNGVDDVFVHDALTSTTERISTNQSTGDSGAGASAGSTISADGSTIAFFTDASDIVPGNPSVPHQIVVQDRASGSRIRASAPQGVAESTAGCSKPSLSDDGRYVGMGCSSPLVPEATTRAAYRFDTVTSQLDWAGVDSGGAPLGGSINRSSVRLSGTGERMVFSSSDFPAGISLGLYEWNIAVGYSTLIDTSAQSLELSGDGSTVVGQDLSGALSRVGLWSLPPVAPPVLAPGSFGRLEGDVGTTTFDLPIRLSRPYHESVTVDFRSIPLTGLGLATEGVDYLPFGPGTLTFAPGETLQTVPVQVIGDTIDEPPLFLGEWFFVAFSNPSPNATLDVSFFGLGIGIIGDDD